MSESIWGDTSLKEQLVKTNTYGMYSATISQNNGTVHIYVLILTCMYWERGVANTQGTRWSRESRLLEWIFTSRSQY